MSQDLTPETAHRIYDILALHCGAPDDDDAVIDLRQQFVTAVAGERPAREYRFRGALGRGGKFRNPGRGEPFFVECYPEDRDPERAQVMLQANRRLLELHTRVMGEAMRGPRDRVHAPAASGIAVL